MKNNHTKTWYILIYKYRYFKIFSYLINWIKKYKIIWWKVKVKEFSLYQNSIWVMCEKVYLKKMCTSLIYEKLWNIKFVFNYKFQFFFKNDAFKAIHKKKVRFLLFQKWCLWGHSQIIKYINSFLQKYNNFFKIWYIA